MGDGAQEGRLQRVALAQGLEVRALREELLPLDGEGDEPADGRERVAFGARSAHDEHAARAAAHGERKVDVARAALGEHLDGLASAADAFEKRIPGVEPLPDGRR